MQIHKRRNWTITPAVFIPLIIFMLFYTLINMEVEASSDLATTIAEATQVEVEENSGLATKVVEEDMRVEVEEISDLATTIVKDMRVGWNLANSLNAFSTNPEAYEIALQKRDKYQIMAIYSTKIYSEWDASQVPYITSDGSEYSLDWNITKLKSPFNLESGKFSFQIINHDVGDTESTLDFTVTKAQFITKDGAVITLNDMVGDHSKPIANKVTTYVSSDLTKYANLKTTADVLGGTLTIGLKINNYPLPKTPKVTKEEYYETLWGNPVTTKAMIEEIKKAGFGAVRIPVTYTNHMDSNGNIDVAWLDRVKQVVQYVMDNNMYCIINVHHDTGDKGWIRADLSTLDTTAEKFINIWKQIASYMNEFDNHLIFEAYNEILNKSNQWSWADSDSYKAANLLNQAFVDAVRSTGRNNSQRCLTVNTYAAGAEEKEISSFILPTDTVNHRLIVQVHYYGTNPNRITSVIERLNKTFVSNGIPVIFGEFGMDLKSSESDRINYANFLVSSAKKYNITAFWWDDGNYSNKVGAKANYGLYDRVAMNWYHSTIAQAIVNASQ